MILEGIIIIIIIAGLIALYTFRDKLPWGNKRLATKTIEQKSVKDVETFDECVDGIIDKIDNYYIEHKDDPEDKTNYNIVSQLRLLKASAAKSGDYNYYYKQLWYTLSDDLKNYKLLDELLDYMDEA